MYFWFELATRNTRGKKDQDLSELILPADTSTVENISLEGTEGLWGRMRTADGFRVWVFGFWGMLQKALAMIHIP